VSGEQMHAAGGGRLIGLDLALRLNPVHRVAGSPARSVKQTVAGGSCAKAVTISGTNANVS